MGLLLLVIALRAVVNIEDVLADAPLLRREIGRGWTFAVALTVLLLLGVATQSLLVTKLFDSITSDLLPA